MSTRIDDFIAFHRYSCRNDSIVMQLKAYADISGYNTSQRELLVLLYGLTYCIPSSIVIMENINLLYGMPEAFWESNKGKLKFQSDRRWVKFNNQFVNSFRDFNQKAIFSHLRDRNPLDLRFALGLAGSASYFARFASFLLLEAYVFMFQRETINDYIDWKHGDTATSGMLTVLGYDEYASHFDATGILKVPEEYLNRALTYIQRQLAVLEGRSALFIETNLCAYRKLFKGTRYAGYYVDRVQEEIEYIIRRYPEHGEALSRLYTARAAVLPPRALGELHGWRGIRKPLCKKYLETGDWHV